MSRTTGRPAALGAVDQVTRTALLSLKDSLSASIAALDPRYVPVAGGLILTDAAQAIPNAAVTDITWGTEVSDPDGWTSGGVAAVTVPAGKAGRYLVTFSGIWTGNPAVDVWVAVNGVAFQATAANVTASVHTLTFLTTLAVADVLVCKVFQTTGVAKNVVSRLEICPV